MCRNVEALKPDTETPKNQQVEKDGERVPPHQGCGANLEVLRYVSA